MHLPPGEHRQTDTSAKINISYSILFHLTTSYSSYFGGKKGISRNKTSFFLLMQTSQDMETIRAFVTVVIVVGQRERDKSRREGKDPSERGTLTSWRARMDEQVWDQHV